eukprot:g13748.t1 g13748   contig9:337139-338545(+)
MSTSSSSPLVNYVGCFVIKCVGLILVLRQSLAFQPTQKTINTIGRHETSILFTPLDGVLLERESTVLPTEVSHNISDVSHQSTTSNYDGVVATAEKPAKPTRSDRAWEEKYKLLMSYYGINGNTLVPTTDPNLGRWIQRQRAQYKKGTMPSYRIQTLLSAGFIFDVHEYNRSKMGNADGSNDNAPKWRKKSWDDRYDELQAYVNAHGDANVPLKYGSLGGWVQHQRLARSKLSAEQQDRLNDLNFVWNARSQQWYEMYNELKDFITKHGHSHIPSSKEFKSLQAWCGAQRQQYRIKYDEDSDKTSSPLSNERESLLSDIGFDWDTKHSSIWRQRIDELKRYERKHGHCNVPHSEGALGAWLMTQRTEYRFRVKDQHTHLTDERVNELESLGCVWSVRDLRWNEKYESVRQHLTEKQKQDDVKKSKLSPSLAVWYRDQKMLYKAMKRGEDTPLKKDRIKKLQILLEDFA